MVSRPILVSTAGLFGAMLAMAPEPAGDAWAQFANNGGNLGTVGGNLGARPGGRAGRHGGGGGFSFTGPPEFYTDGRMTCHRAKSVMHFRLGYSDLVVHDCSGRRYRIEGYRDGHRWLVTLDAFTTNPVSTRRIR